MSSIQQGSSTAISFTTSGATDNSQSSHNATLGETLNSRGEGLLLKRPSGSDEPSQTLSKILTRASKEEGPLWNPAQQVAFLRSLPHGQPIKSQEVSTDLVLYTPPWMIQKKLHASDLGHLSRLLLPKADVKRYVLPLMGDEMVTKIGSRDGMKVTVLDLDTSSDHPLVLKYWWKPGFFVLNGNWINMFVNRRGLKVGDEIGLFWNHYNQKFFFTVLKQ